MNLVVSFRIESNGDYGLGMAAIENGVVVDSFVDTNKRLNNAFLGGFWNWMQPYLDGTEVWWIDAVTASDPEFQILMDDLYDQSNKNRPTYMDAGDQGRMVWGDGAAYDYINDVAEDITRAAAAIIAGGWA